MLVWTLPFVIAHRGASQVAPENTLSSLKRAKTDGALAVECDVQLTRDQQAVIFHDISLTRTTNGFGLLSSKTLSQIKSLDAGSWFSSDYKNERVPTLIEWIQCAAELKINLNLEIKARTQKQGEILSTIICDAIAKYWPSTLPLPLISSSNRNALIAVKKQSEKLQTGLIIEQCLSDQFIAAILQEKCVSVHQPYSLFTEKYISRLHQHGLRAVAYTVNDETLLQKLKAMGIDGVFSDIVGE